MIIRSLGSYLYTLDTFTGVINCCCTHTLPTQISIASPESSVISNCRTIPHEWHTGILRSFGPSFVQTIPDRHLAILDGTLFDPVTEIIGVIGSWINPCGHAEDTVGKDLNN